MNPKVSFRLKFIGSLALALLGAVSLSYNFLSFAIVFVVMAWVFCPVRKFKEAR